MRSVVALLTTCALLLAFAATASAVHQGIGELGTSGYIATVAMWNNNLDFEDPDGQDSFRADQRVRQYFDYIASENLKATVAYEIDQIWGETGAGGEPEEDAPFNADTHGNIEIKRAMMEFTLPGTETQISSGIQPVYLPDVAMGSNPVLAADAAGVQMSTPVGQTADLTLGWTRGYDYVSDNAEPGVDALFASLPISQDGFSVSPYAAYTIMGKNTQNAIDGDGFRSGFNTPDHQPLTDSANAYWLGASTDINMFDPVGIAAGAVYGSLDADQDRNDRSGFYADLSVSYEMPNMTPEFLAFYASGEDDDVTDGSESMPILHQSGLTNYGAHDSWLISFTPMGLWDGTGKGTGGLMQTTPVGLWGVAFSLNDMALTDKLKYDLYAGYYQGTNDKDVAGDLGSMDNALTEEDSAYEVTLQGNYHIYEQLSAIMEASYAALDMDEDVWSKDYKDEPATRLGVGLKYDF